MSDAVPFIKNKKQTLKIKYKPPHKITNLEKSIKIIHTENNFKKWEKGGLL